MALVGLTACDEQYTTYSDAEYVIFADTLSTHMVGSEQSRFTIPIASTVACDYDRTLGVEIVDQGSNAIEGWHYRLPSNTVTIPAGERTVELEVEGIYDHIEPTDSLGFTLRLVMPEQLKWDLYADHNQTKVVMYKSCPFDIHTFTGWCVLTSLYLYSYPGENTSYQRLIYTELHPTQENTIILHDAFYDGYDITMRFDASDPANPRLEMDDDQVISDEMSVFGQILGDNHIRATDSYYYDSYFNACQHFGVLWLQVYVEYLGESIGTVGHFYNILEWVSDEEVERLQREGL